MTLVEIRCKRCRSLLCEVTEVPGNWGGVLQFPACSRCADGRPGNRRFARWARAQIRRGRVLPFVTTVAMQVRWTDLRPAVETALATGHTQGETV